MTITITDALADTLTAEQLALLTEASHESHDAHWLETSERKRWLIVGHARQVSPGRILVWTRTDEAGVADVELCDGDNAEAAAVSHAHAIAAGLDGRGPMAYVIEIVDLWEKSSEAPQPVTAETVAAILAKWIQGASDAGDRDTLLVARALAELV